DGSQRISRFQKSEIDTHLIQELILINCKVMEEIINWKELAAGSFAFGNLQKL
ncbi:unnamed protein product, partial [Ilex paraguariensis]